jgi:hypothetical protein
VHVFRTYSDIKLLVQEASMRIMRETMATISLPGASSAESNLSKQQIVDKLLEYILDALDH